MISKAIRGSGFSGAISYIAEKSDSIRTINIAADNWRSAASEMRAVANLNTTKKCVYHSILSWSPDEKISDEMMFSAAQKMLEKLGLEQHQHVMALHKDKDHLHVHTVTNLINFDGKAQKLSHDFRIRPALCRAIEEELNLKPYEAKKRDQSARFSAQKIDQILAASRTKNQSDFGKFLSEIGVSMNEKSSKSRAINYRFVDVESGAEVPGSQIDQSLSSPSKLKAHFAEKTNVAASKTASVQTEKSTWDTSKNMIVQRAAAAAKNWDDLREKLQGKGIKVDIITRENGARGVVFVDDAGNRIAGSKISSDLSFSKIEKRFEQPQTTPPAPPPPPKPKSDWDKYSEARAEHFQRLGKSPEQIKVDLENIKKSREKLWKEYRYKTSLIPKCFSPQYRGIMRRIERNNFEKSKLRLEKQAQALRDQRFPSLDDWKAGAVRPTPKPKPKAPSIFVKLKSFFFPIAEQSKQYHQKHIYRPTPIQKTVIEPQKLRPIASTTTPSHDVHDVMALLNHPSVVRAANAIASFSQKRSNHYDQRNDDGQR